MTMDQEVDSRIVGAVPTSEEEVQEEHTRDDTQLSRVTENSKDDSAKGFRNLTEEEKTIADTYRRMLKVLIPKDAVRHKMKQDSIDPKIVIAMLGEDPAR